jgi:hypothetical protein
MQNRNLNAIETRRLLSPDNSYMAAGQNNFAMIFYTQRTASVLRSLSLWTIVASLAVTWQESCENPSIFCYRVGRRFFTRDAA